MDIKKIKKIHFIGVGGIGLSALARLMIFQGKEVSGSDVEESDLIKKLQEEGLDFFAGHYAKNIKRDLDFIVYSAAVPDDNVERQQAFYLNIKQISYPEFLGKISSQYKLTAISGTHGKSTTSSICGLLLEAGGLDPTVVVGSKVKTFPYENLRIGKSNYFVAEACEYKGHMMHLNPSMVILTNIEKDHLDYYVDEDSIIDTFQAFIDKVPSDGLLIKNVDDPNLAKLKTGNDHILTFGIENKADVLAKNIYTQNEKQYFDLYYHYKKLGKIELQIPGRFNIYNCLGAITLALHSGVDFAVIQKTLQKFKGIWRRFEKVAEIDGSVFISDYGHHPTAIKNTLQAAREFYPTRRIILAYQPHQHNRTKNLFTDFIESFDQVDFLILNKIYDVAGREEKEDQDVSSEKLVEAISGRFDDKKLNKKVLYAPDLKSVESLILQNVQPNDLVIIMGAGDIYKIVEKIKQEKK